MLLSHTTVTSTNRSKHESSHRPHLPAKHSVPLGTFYLFSKYHPVDAFRFLRLVQFGLGLVFFLVAPLVQLKTMRL